MNRNSTSAIFSGNESLLIHCAEAYLNAGHSIRAVITARPGTVRWAEARGIAVLADEAALIRRPEIAFDYLFNMTHSCAVPGELIFRAQRRALDFHASLFPRHADGHAPAWALMAQATRHGVSWREMTPVNEGRAVRQAAFDIPAGETALSLQARCYEAGLESFTSLIGEMGKTQEMAQGAARTLTEATAACRCASHEPHPPILGTLDFSRPAAELARLVGALDFGPYPNPVARAKIYLGDHTLLVRSARIPAQASGAAPGTVLQVNDEGVRLATAEGDIVLGGLADAWGAAPGPALAEGMVLPALTAPLREQLARRAPEIGQGERFWHQAFATLAPVEIPYPQKPRAPQPGPRQLIRARLEAPAHDSATTAAAFFAWLTALTAQQRISMLYSDSVLKASASGLECWLSPWVPLTLETTPDGSAQQAAERAASEIVRMHQAGPCPRDLPSRLGRTRAGERWDKVGLSLGGIAAPAEADLTLMSGSDGLSLAADAAVFSSETLQRMAGHLAVYLKAFPGAARVAAIPLLPEDETGQLAALNATATPCDATLGVHEAIAAQAARTPHHPALSFRGQTLSYRELDDRATALAGRLAARGVRAGDIVGLCLERGPDLVAGVLAILKTGAGYLPLDPAYPHDRLLYMIEDSGAALVMTRRAVTEKLAIPAEKVFWVDEPEQCASPVPGRAAGCAPAGAPRIAYLIYTSGSTGRPKGVVVTHPNVLNFFAGLDARIPHDPPGRWIAVTSLCFDISVLELCWTLTRGFTIVLHSNAFPYGSVAQTILDEQVTHLQCTPSMASMLVADTAGRQALSRLSALLVGGEALSLKLAGELRALVPGALFNMYGPTETTVWSTACELADIGDFVPLGQPIANTRLSIRTPAGAECPALVAGELLIGGAGVSGGYWQRPELNAERFMADPAAPGARFYRTGDLVRRHPGGALEFLGRIDHQVKIRGHRIELGEIESVLLRQPGVKEAVVIAREDAAGDWSLAAYVTPHAEGVLDTGHIRRSMAEKLPDIMVPKAIVMLHEFPLTPNGKVDRRALPSPRPETAEAGAELPQSLPEKAIAAVWEQVLGQSKVAATDNFFDLDGSFFRAVQVQHQLQAAHGCRVGLADMVRFPTPRELAAHLGQAAPGLLAGAGLDNTPVDKEAAGAANANRSPGQDALEPVESALAQLWRDLLGIEEIHSEDDFFALGGHSLTAVRLFAQIRKQFAVELPLATLFEAPTLAALAATVKTHLGPEASASATGALPFTRPAPRAFSPLVTICRGRPGRRPLFFIHGAGGNVLNYKVISDRLGPDQPFYGLQAQGVDGKLPFHTTIEAMAAQYVEAVRSVDPHGPYQLAGFSGGGVIAFEMAQQLTRAGAKIALLGMIDTLSPEAEKRKIPFLRRLWLLRHWSLKFAMERSEQSKKDRMLPPGVTLAQDNAATAGPYTQEVADFYLFRNYLQAQNRYQAQPYHGSLVLFRATQARTQYLAAGNCLGWEEHIRGDIRVTPIDGSHLTMMVMPGVEKVVEGFGKELALCEEISAALAEQGTVTHLVTADATPKGKLRAA